MSTPLSTSEADILEKTCRIQRAYRLRRLVISHRIADLDRQITEDGSGFGALYSFDADVFNYERIEGFGVECHDGGNGEKCISEPAHRLSH
jgi:hypothetical protein